MSNFGPRAAWRRPTQRKNTRSQSTLCSSTVCGPSRAKEKCAQCMVAPVEHYENPAVIVRRAWGRAPVPVFIRVIRGHDWFYRKNRNLLPQSLTKQEEPPY